MKLYEFREMYPEFDDVSDEEVVATYDIEVGEVADLTTPILYSIEGAIEGLCQTVAAIQIPDKSADVLALLKQIKNGLGSLEVAIKSIDVQVNVPAPVVNMPKMEKVVIPEAVKEWTFEIIRNRNGYITEVIAKEGAK